MNIAEFLKTNGLVKEGKLNNEGWQLFSGLLDFVGPYPDLTPGIIPSPYNIFDKYLSRLVAASQELVLIRNKQIYLTWRNDQWWKGWHVPGGFVKPRETYLATCQRLADWEGLGIKITSAVKIDAVSAVDNPRFHNAVFIVRAEFEGEPTGGQWFKEFPLDFLGVQRCYIPILKPLLG